MFRVKTTMAVVGLILAAWSANAALAEEKAVAITGKVLLDGKVPTPAAINMAADPKCAAMRKDEKLFNQTWVVGKDNQLANVFVSIKGLPKDKKWEVPKEPVVLDQRGCEYHPRVFGVMVGQDLEIRNSDPTSHNVHALPKLNKEFNVGQPNKGMKKTVKFEKPEDFRIKCDVHAWMASFPHVTDHPFFAVTDAEGHYSIKADQLPAGEYELTFWHESGAKASTKIKFEEGKALAVEDVKIAPPKAGARPGAK